MNGDPEHGEHFRSVPWDALVTDDARRRRRWLALVGAGTIVAGAAFGATTLLGGPPPPDLAVEPVPASDETTTTPPVVSTSLLGEDDLMAASTADGTAGEAGALAAWFVADYLTVDGTQATRRAVEDRLPAGVEPVAPGDGTRSFVESAFPLSVEPVDGGYRVVVLARYLVSTDGESYRRPAALAAEVTVAIDEEGMAIADLPSPLPVPDPVRAPLTVGPVETIPEHITEAAIAEASSWGSPTGELEAGRVGDDWRVVAVVEDPAGMRLSVALRLDEAGARL